MENKTEQTKSASGVVINKKGEVLVVNQKGNSWSLPKGHIEAREDAMNAAKREIYEESGVTALEFIRGLGSYERYGIGKKGRELKMITMFLFRTNEDSLRPVDPDNPEARWVHKEEVAELLTHPKDKEFFGRISKEI